MLSVTTLHQNDCPL